MKYKKISENIQRVIIDNPETLDKKLTWINITNTGKKEISYLRKKYHFQLDHLHASLSNATAQRPIVSRSNDGKYLFMILHFPTLQNCSKDNENNHTCDIVAGEIEFFISRGRLITLHNNDLTTLNNFFNLCKKDGNSLLSYKFESAAILLYELLTKLVADCYPLLDKNSIAISQIEKIIFEQRQKQAVSKILSLRRNIINCRKIIQNHKNILKKLIKIENSLVPAKEIRNYYNQLIEHSKRIWEILDNQKEMIEILNSTNESMLNYKISDIMKTLTIFSVIVFPLTLVAAIFGMNIMNGMPFIETENGFWIIIVIMLIGSLFMLLFFEKKKWL